jgi:hypothetical protein
MKEEAQLPRQVRYEVQLRNEEKCRRCVTLGDSLHALSGFVTLCALCAFVVAFSDSLALGWCVTLGDSLHAPYEDKEEAQLPRQVRYEVQLRNEGK